MSSSLPPPLSQISSSSASSSVKLEDSSHQKTTTNSSNDLPQPPIQSAVVATPLSQTSVTIPHDAGDSEQQDSQSVLDQHEEDVTDFLNNYTQSTRVIDQFDVARALMQSQVARVQTPPPPPPPPLETYEALLSGQPPGRKSPALPIQTTTNRMLFGKNDKALSNRRRLFASNANASSDYEADLSSTDKIKAQQSVMRFLRDKIRTDWEYTWPRPISENPDTEYEFDEDGIADWREREDWESGISDDDEENRLEEIVVAVAETKQADPSQEVALKEIPNGSPPKTPSRGTQEPVVPQDQSPFRFETPEKVGEIVKQKISDKKERRRKRRLEMQSWNEGLDCWTRRRDAWTCARKISPSSISQDNTTQNTFSNNLPTNEQSILTSKGKSKMVEARGKETPYSSSVTQSLVNSTTPPIIQVPFAHSLIPPENIIRSQVVPSNYGMIYGKVVTESITPKCTINLKDMTRCCVEGWKREGEWPPRPSVPEASIAKRGGIRIKGLNGLLGKGRSDSGGSLAAAGLGDAGRRSSLASALGLDKVRSVFTRRGSGSVKDGDAPISPTLLKTPTQPTSPTLLKTSNPPTTLKEGEVMGEVESGGKGKA